MMCRWSLSVLLLLLLLLLLLPCTGMLVAAASSFSPTAGRVSSPFLHPSCNSFFPLKYPSHCGQVALPWEDPLQLATPLEVATIHSEGDYAHISFPLRCEVALLLLPPPHTHSAEKKMSDALLEPLEHRNGTANTAVHQQWLLWGHNVLVTTTPTLLQWSDHHCTCASGKKWRPVTPSFLLLPASSATTTVWVMRPVDYSSPISNLSAPAKALVLLALSLLPVAHLVL